MTDSVASGARKATVTGVVAAIAVAMAAVLGGSHGLKAQTMPFDRDPIPRPPELGDPLGSGPDKAIVEVNPGLPKDTIYRPANLDHWTKSPMPVVVWAEGGCENAGNSVRPLLTEIASYGYFVIAIGEFNPALPYYEIPRSFPARPPGASTEPMKLPPPATHTPQLIQAMDWATAEASGQYKGRIDASRIAVMGHSCGGLQALEASTDPRVTTTMVMDSGLLQDGSDMAGGRFLTKADLGKLHAPIAYISGDAEGDGLAFGNADDDFNRVHVPALRAWERGVTHQATYKLPNGGEYAGVMLGWLNWRLKGDTRAAKLFLGADCGLCVNPRWVVRTKGLR